MRFRIAALLCLPVLFFAGCDDEDNDSDGGNSSSNHNAEFQELDDWVKSFIKKYEVPGAAIAVTSHGRLVHAKGFGFANSDTGERFRADTPARVGSLSKLVTASSILKLVERGALDVDERVFGAGALLPGFRIPAGADPRVTDITARDFLIMASGWDPEVVGDTTVPPTSLENLAETGTRLPPSRKAASSGMLNRKLSFRPGTEYRYLNVSPIFLSEIVARKTGISYERFVTENLLRPIGLYSPRLAGTRKADRQLGEAAYNQAPDYPSLYPGDGMLPLSYAYGLLDLHLIGPTGGWLFSAVDIAALFAHIEGTRTPELLSPALRTNFYMRPAGIKTWRDTSIFFGFGTENFDNGEFWGKYGSMPSVAAWVGHFSDDFSVAVILNGRELSGPEVYDPPFGGTTFDQELREGIRTRLRDIPGDLEGDLFETKYNPRRPAFTGTAVAVGKAGSAFRHRLTGLPNNVHFLMEPAVPGLRLDPTTGEISGTPEKTGRFQLPVTISNEDGSSRANLDVHIGTPGSPVRSGAAFCPRDNQFVLRQGRIVDVVVMQSTELLVSPRDGVGVQVLLVDADGDLVVAELEGKGKLTIRLDQGRLVSDSRAGARVSKGNPELILSGANRSTVFRYYAIGSLNSEASATGNGVASARRLWVKSDAVGSLYLGNSEFGAATGIAGISAPETKVFDYLTLGEINASGTASPILTFSTTGSVLFLGSVLHQENGKPIEISGIDAVEAFFGADANGNVEEPVRPDATFIDHGVDITERLFPTD